MSGKLCTSSSVKNILVVSLSNIGDVVLTCPVMDVLLRDFPLASMTVIVGPKAASLFAGHPKINVMVYDKHQSWRAHIQWFLNLIKNKFDVVVDLRQSALGVLLPSRWHTPLGTAAFAGHMRLKHLARLKSVYPDFFVPDAAIAIIPDVNFKLDLTKYVVMAPGAADSAKRWAPSGFAQVADRLMKQGYEFVFVGDNSDVVLIEEIRRGMKNPALSLAGQTDLRQLAAVLCRAQFAIVHDSGTMHLASYFNVPLIALWGPTSQAKYGPQSLKSQVVFRQGKMPLITVEDVLNAVHHLQ